MTGASEIGARTSQGRKRLSPLLLWLGLSLSASAALSVAMFSEEPAVTPAKQLFLPGKTTAGHYQIELSCGSCHSKDFADQQAIQSACEGCHGAELDRSQDSHPRDKFTDPRNAERSARLDASHCATCHLEHRPEVATGMGVTLPEDYCYRCHENIAEERASHKGMAFNSCDDAGCHNFHDNRAIYEDFLTKHAGQPSHKQEAISPLSLSSKAPRSAARALLQEPRSLEGEALSDWELSAHANAGVTCAGCHADPKGQWSDPVTHQACQSCHSAQVGGFLQGRHGMRLSVGLSPMLVGDARLSMRSDASHLQLDCNSCHASHRYDTRFAAAEACLGCHDDSHTLAYAASKHASLWQAELQGTGRARSGVSCASCHLPRVSSDGSYTSLGADVVVQHNQNDNLRPNDKMIRSVCLDCHGLGFAINALAEPALIRRNFGALPQVNVSSIELALDRKASGAEALSHQVDSPN